MSALLVEPHTDDCVLFATFLALREEAHVVTVLRSKVQERYGITAEEREREHRNAMALLGLSHLQWAFNDDAPDWTLVERRMVELSMPEYGYDRVYVPAVLDDGHEQHNQVGEIAERVFGDRVAGRYLTYRRHRGKAVDGDPVAVGDPGWVTLKLRALACYRSQIETPAANCWMHFLRDQNEYLQAQP